MEKMSFPEMSLGLLISARQCKVPVVQMENGPTCSPDLSAFANILCAMKQKMQQKRLQNEILSVREWESIKLPPKKSTFHLLFSKFFFFETRFLTVCFIQLYWTNLKVEDRGVFSSHHEAAYHS